MKPILILLFTAVMFSACNKNSDVNGACYINPQPYVYSQGGARIIFPTAFTPNGDGRNEYFGPLGLTGINSFSMTISDKDGNIMFRTIDLYTQGWDGHTNTGIQLATGNYTVSFQFTTVNGDHIDQSTCVALVDYSTAGCIPRPLTGNYYFPDMIDVSNTNHYFGTTEYVCP